MKNKLFLKIILITMTTVIVLGILYYFNFVAKAQMLTNHYPVYDKTLKHYQLVKDKPKHWVALKDISKIAVQAIVISEDWAFYQHDGIDKKQIELAIKDSVEEGKLSRGASTITQQVVKNALLTPEKSLIRKMKEVILAQEVENILNKDQILEMYLNLIELGDGLYGIKAGSQFYFRKAPIDLSPKEGAFLAMLLPSPKKYSQSYFKRKLTDFAALRIDDILINLRQAKIFTEQERLEYAQETLLFERNQFLEEYPDEEEVVEPTAKVKVKSKPSSNRNQFLDEYPDEEVAKPRRVKKQKKNQMPKEDFEKFDEQRKQADDILKKIKKDGINMDGGADEEY